MAYEFDRIEKEDGGGSFLMGLLAGTVLGAGLGMLFAPKAGADVRRQLSEQANRLRSTANDTYHQASDKVTQIVERGREAVERGRDAFERARGHADTASPSARSHLRADDLSTPASTNRL
jgi:gas vesicle protein